MDQEALTELLDLDYRGSTAEVKQHLRQLLVRGGLRAVIEQRISSRASDKTVVAIMMAKLYSRIGDNERALFWLDRAVNGQKLFWTAYIGVDPLYDPLRADPRFRSILNRMGLEM